MLRSELSLLHLVRAVHIQTKYGNRVSFGQAQWEISPLSPQTQSIAHF